MKRRFRKIISITSILLLLIIVGIVYSLFFRPNYGGSNHIVVLILGLLLGGVIVFLTFSLLSKRGSVINSVSTSQIIVESIKKVFKVVSAEGHFQEIYNYEETKKILKVLPSTKKALVVVTAKVLVGYDLEKFKWNLDTENRTLQIIEFPQPEILSIEPDYKYHSIEEDLFNFLKRDDLHKIQAEAKEAVKEAVNKSDLKLVANEQIQLLLNEMMVANQWQISNPEKMKLLSKESKIKKKENSDENEL